MAKYKQEEQRLEEENLSKKIWEEKNKQAALAINNPSKALEDYYYGKIEKGTIPAYSQIFFAVQYMPTEKSEARKDFYKICKKLIEEKAEILEFETNRVREVRVNDFLSNIALMCQYSLFFIRDIDTWEKTTHNVTRQYYSIVDHLFVKKQIPEFMYSVWGNRSSSHQIDWFIAMGEGKSIKGDRKLPPGFTSKMLHHFMYAPGEYTIDEALVWGRVKAFGGDERLVNSICESRLRNVQFNEFWDSVLRFFANNPMLDSAHVAPIIDYLYNQKYERVIPRDADGNVIGPPVAPQPNLSMKGRNVDSLLRESEYWHMLQSLDQKRREIERKRAIRDRARGVQYVGYSFEERTWKPIGVIREFQKEEGNKDTRSLYKIVELLSSKELREEGSNMGHCVGSYSSSCASGKSTIWSLRFKFQDGPWQRLVTIEINPGSYTIVQARGPRNCQPTKKEKQIMAEWAAREGIKFSRWI